MKTIPILKYKNGGVCLHRGVCLLGGRGLPVGGCLPARGVSACQGVYTSPPWTDRHLQKHNLSATTIADGNKRIVIATVQLMTGVNTP